MKNCTWALAAFFLGASVFSIASQADQARLPAADEGWSFSGNFDSIHLKKSSAQREWLGETAYALGAAAEYYQKESHLVYGAGINVMGYDDKAGFSQQTNKGEKDSSASGIAGYVELGSRFWLGQTHENFLSLHGGVSVVTASSRGIGYCSNCYSEDINIDGGAYGTIRLGHRFRGVDVSIHYQKYFSGDIENAFGIKVATHF